jgi:hypothetical protein
MPLISTVTAHPVDRDHPIDKDHPDTISMAGEVFIGVTGAVVESHDDRLSADGLGDRKWTRSNAVW